MTTTNRTESNSAPLKPIAIDLAHLRMDTAGASIGSCGVDACHPRQNEIRQHANNLSYEISSIGSAAQKIGGLAKAAAAPALVAAVAAAFGADAATGGMAVAAAGMAGAFSAVTSNAKGPSKGDKGIA